MRLARPGLVVVAAWLFFSPAGADVYIKEANSTQSYLLGFRTGTENLPASELWMGETRIAYYTAGRTFIVDLEARRFTLINTDDRTYVESPLPLDLSTLLSPRLRARYEAWSRSGTVNDTGRTGEILGKTAREYRLDIWEVDNGTRSNEQSVKVWATTDVELDWKRIDELLEPLRIVLNRDQALRDELREIEGVQLRVEWWTGWFLKSRRHRTDVVEIALDREPPAGVYAPPEGFRKKDLLTQGDV